MVTIERSQHLDFDRLQSFPAHEIAEARARLLGRRFQDRPARPDCCSFGFYAADGNEAIPYSPAAFQFRS